MGQTESKAPSQRWEARDLDAATLFISRGRPLKGPKGLRRGRRYLGHLYVLWVLDVGGKEADEGEVCLPAYHAGQSFFLPLPLPWLPLDFFASFHCL